MSYATMEFTATHQHATLGELLVRFYVKSTGEMKLHEIQLTQREVINHEVERYHCKVFFGHSGDAMVADYINRKAYSNGAGSAGKVTDEPFLADLNTFANSAALGRIMRRKLDAALRALTIARKELN